MGSGPPFPDAVCQGKSRGCRSGENDFDTCQKLNAVTDVRYFIAIIPPEPVYSEAQSLKETMRNRFNTKGALRSPPHITLHMPFLWSEKKTDRLLESLHELCNHLSPTEIALNGFGCFPPRVIFLNVEPTAELKQLQSSIRDHCRMKLHLINDAYKDQPFHPHLTIAFRDLRKAAFQTAWEECRSATFDHRFMAEDLVLLKYDDRAPAHPGGSTWNIFHRFPFPKIPMS